METAGYRGRSRRQEPKGKTKKEKKLSHFRTVRFGGFDENQMICYLWDIVKSVETVSGGKQGQELERLVRQLRGRIRVEIRRYFIRRRRRNVKAVAAVLSVVLCAAVVFGFLIGVDCVSGNSMYPYLNHGDWIVYRRSSSGLKRNDVVVFEHDGEYLVKRIAGLPGDTVEVNASGNRVVVNGVQVREDYVTLPEGADSDDREMSEERSLVPMTVMDGQYMVLGDNRSISIDSRDARVGTVPQEDIRGMVILVIRIG